jgi:hypothetical protein
MDQGRPLAGVLIGAALLLAADAPAQLPIRDVRWLAAGVPVERVNLLPAECFRAPADPKERRSAEIGRIVFRAPLLLGGQAARVGLGCSSCHRNGRNNPDFHFPGISGAPGTADVTASLLSSHRGDGKFNPKPIPDLAGDPSKRIVSRDPAKPDLERFIHGLITQEFDGPEPPATVLRGVAAYVRSIDAQHCDGGDTQLDAGSLIADVDSALRLARSEPDPATARVLIAAARSNLGRLDERFQLPGLEGDRALLTEADGELLGLQESLGTRAEPGRWRDWDYCWPARKRRIEADAQRSLFSDALLKKYAGARLSSRD